MEHYSLYIIGIAIGAIISLAVLYSTKNLWGKSYIDSKFIEDRFSEARLHDIVIRQMWVANENAQAEYLDPCICPDYDRIQISKKDAFDLNLHPEDDFNERAAIYFIRNGVRAHYQELRAERESTAPKP